MRWSKVTPAAFGLVFGLAFVATAAPAAAAPPRSARANMHEPPRLPWRELPTPRLPSPFILPDLSHPRVDAGIDMFLGGMAAETPHRPASVVTLVRASVEASMLRSRRLFLGATLPYASALPPDGGRLVDSPPDVPAEGAKSMLGNLQLHIRAVFPMPTWLDVGFLFAISTPTARFDRSHPANLSVSEAAISLDPTDYVLFLPGRVALRPAVDFRILREPFIFQARQGIDIIVDDKGIERAKVAGRILLHAGVLARRDLEVSIEASQIYFFFADEKTNAPSSDLKRAFEDKYRISDDRRTAMTIGPGIRLSLPTVDIGASLVTNILTPLSPASDRFIALRLSLIGHLAGPPRPW